MWRKKRRNARDEKINRLVHDYWLLPYLKQRDVLEDNFFAVLRRCRGEIDIVIFERPYSTDGAWVYYWQIDADLVAGALKGFSFLRNEVRATNVGIAIDGRFIGVWPVTPTEAMMVAARIPVSAQVFHIRNRRQH